ncbi:hypothetical protein X946_5381 [Burkholderia sp. ABCPW 111]|nr:hypothetical protein X946_5381 [Burkholderia sp. ABCPW 111]
MTPALTFVTAGNDSGGGRRELAPPPTVQSLALTHISRAYL